MRLEANRWLGVTLTVTLMVAQAAGADILMAAMPDGKSHAGSFVPLLKQLVKQGSASDLT